MRVRALVIHGCTLAGVIALVCAAGLTAHAQATTDLIYAALSKNVAGNGTAKYLKGYTCTVPPGPNGVKKDMRKITLPLKLNFTPHSCDEDGHAGTITTTWTILLRVGPPPAGGGFVPFGTHSGTGTYVDGAGNTIKCTFAGTVGCGTHRDPFMDCEVCRRHLHVEGWLTGKFTAGPIFNTYIALGLPAPQIKATYMGNLNGEWPSPTRTSTAMTITMAIDGVYIFNCGG